MRKKTLAFLSFFFLISLCALYFSFGLRGRFTLTNYSSSSSSLTYSVEKILLSNLGKNKLFVNKNNIRKQIEDLSYIESASLSLSGTKIDLTIENIEDALILRGSDSYYFYSDSIYPLEKKDILPLSKNYVILDLDDSVIAFLLEGKETREIRKMINTLASLSSRSSLITKAEYDNNKSSIFSGSLTLYLEPIESILVVDDIRDLDRLDDALNILEEQYFESKDRLNGERREYILSASSIIKLR